MAQSLKKRSEKSENRFNEFMNNLKSMDSLRDLVNLYAEARTGKNIDVDDFLFVDELDTIFEIDLKIQNRI